MYVLNDRERTDCPKKDHIGAKIDLSKIKDKYKYLVVFWKLADPAIILLQQGVRCISGYRLVVLHSSDKDSHGRCSNPEPLRRFSQSGNISSMPIDAFFKPAASLTAVTQVSFHLAAEIRLLEVMQVCNV